jgi:RNA polymerase sigma-70 factor (ECF subfamily)
MPAYAGVDDDRLMEAIKAGDSAALETLYDRHSAAVLAVTKRVLGEPADAEDAVLDVFLQVWERADRYERGRSGALAFLMTLARSRAIDRLRERQRRRARLVAPGDEQLLDGLDAQLGDPTPLQVTLSAERRARVQSALARLDPAVRSAVELSFFHGLTHPEIAEQLGQPLGTVKTRIRQGLIQLRQWLGQGPDRGEPL